MNSPSEPIPSSPKKRRFPRKRTILLTGLILILAAAWFSYAPLVRWAIHTGLPAGLAPMGLSFTGVKEIDVRLGRPIRLIDLEFGPLAGAPESNQTKVTIGEAEIALASLSSLLFDRDHLLDRVSIRNAQAMFDYRAATQAPPQPIPSLSDQQKQTISRATRFAFPRQVGLENSDIRIRVDGQYFELLGVDAGFYERRVGWVKIDYSKIRSDSGAISLDLANGRALTALNEGTLYLSEFSIGPNAEIESFSVNLARPGGPGFSANARLGEAGWVRFEGELSDREGEPFLDAALWMGKIKLADLSELLHFSAPAEGTLTEGQFRFRGTPGKELDGEASLQLSASQFRWQSRGWEKLDLSGGWTHRQLFISQFSLAQKENQIVLSGQLGLGQGPFDLTKASFSLQGKGDVRDLADLADLAGESLRGTTGQAQFSGELRGGQGQYTGKLDANAEKVTLSGTPLGSLQLAFEAKGREVFLRKFTVRNGKDSLDGEGSVEVPGSHQYTASLKGRIADIHAYSNLIPALAELKSSGGVDLDWQGDGSAATHSGAFTLWLKDLVLPWTPEGLNGKFTGTYSPENVYFSEVNLRRDSLRLTLRLSAGKNGIYADHILLGSGSRDLLAGQFYAPFNPLTVLAQKPWREGILSDQKVYADLRSRAVPIADLAALTGQTVPVEGDLQFSLKASGPLLDPLLEASVDWKNLRLLMENGGEIAPFQGQLNFRSEKGQATVGGNLRAPLLQPIQLNAAFPFGFVEKPDGALAFADPNGALSGRILFPKTPLKLFAPFLTGVRELDGQLSGSMELSNQLFAPQIKGTAELKGGRIGFGRNAPGFQNLTALVTFSGSEARLDYLKGDVGAGPFNLTGSVNFADFSKVTYRAALKGQKILLARDSNVRLRANVDLTAEGVQDTGSINGAIRLVDGRIFRRLEITPLLVGADTGQTSLLLPNLAGLVPAPFGTWKLNVALNNETPFLLAGNIAAGEIEPQLRIGGTLNDPRPEGEITLRNVRAFLPFSVMEVPEGHIYLRADNPRVPILDVRGNSQVLEYNIQAYAFGPLDEGNLILRSDPPLQQESIILMLTTGLAPGALSGAGFGEAAMGQGGLLLMRAFVRQFDSDQVDLESLVNRLQVRAIPPLQQGDPATLRGEFRLFDQLSLVSERDTYGFFNAGVTYRLRLR